MGFEEVSPAKLVGLVNMAPGDKLGIATRFQDTNLLPYLQAFQNEWTHVPQKDTINDGPKHGNRIVLGRAILEVIEASSQKLDGAK